MKVLDMSLNSGRWCFKDFCNFSWPEQYIINSALGSDRQHLSQGGGGGEGGHEVWKKDFFWRPKKVLKSIIFWREEGSYGFQENEKEISRCLQSRRGKQQEIDGKWVGIIRVPQTPSPTHLYPQYPENSILVELIELTWKLQMILYCISLKNVLRKDKCPYSRSNFVQQNNFKKLFFRKKIKMKITNDPILHFFEERFTERQIFLLEV